MYIIKKSSSTYLQGALQDTWLQLIWSIKSKGISIYSLCAYSFLTTQKGQSPTLSNHFSALIMHESHKNVVYIGLHVSHHQLDKYCDWYTIILLLLSRLNVHTNPIILHNCIPVIHLLDGDFSIISSQYIHIHKRTLQVLVMVVYIECLVKEILFCLYNKMWMSQT